MPPLRPRSRGRTVALGQDFSTAGLQHSPPPPLPRQSDLQSRAGHEPRAHRRHLGDRAPWDASPILGRNCPTMPALLGTRTLHGAGISWGEFRGDVGCRGGGCRFILHFFHSRVLGVTLFAVPWNALGSLRRLHDAPLFAMRSHTSRGLHHGGCIRSQIAFRMCCGRGDRGTSPRSAHALAGPPLAAIPRTEPF